MKQVRMLSTALIFLAISGVTLASAQRGRADAPGQQKKLPPQEQQARVQEQQKRTAQYQQHLDQQVRVAQQQNAQLQQQKRTAQLRAQQQYAAQLQQQRQQLQAPRNYVNDPYTSTPNTYRYSVSGSPRQTNQFGADVLRQSVNTGYQQGVRAGQADRQDGQRSNFRNSFAYQDANYGYTGQYIDQADYNYYFRQGFQRGYQDGYASQTQYGTVSNGSSSILSNVLSSILGLVSIH